MTTKEITDLGRTVEELGASRGFSGLEELAEAINAAVEPEEHYTAAELADWPRTGWGVDLDAVLGLSEDERRRIVEKVVERINRPRARVEARMKMELQQAWSPDIMRETPCDVCGVRFCPESVVAFSSRGLEVCPECIAYLGRRNPREFPTIEEYQAALARYPEPLFPSTEELERAEQDERRFAEIHAASEITLER